MQIRIITPPHVSELQPESMAVPAGARSFTKVSVDTIDPDIGDLEDESGAAAETILVQHALQAEREGMDAVVINCPEDTGLSGARAVLQVPVVGLAEASLHFAATVAQRFTVITAMPDDIPAAEELIVRYRLTEQAGPVRALSIPAGELKADPRRALQALAEVAIVAICLDGSGAIVPDSAALAGFAPAVEAMLAQRGYLVAVLEPLEVALRQAESMAALGMRQTRHGSH